MIIYFYLLHATILITFPQHTLACDRILSDERVGPISSSFGSPECGDYNFFLHRETCLKGNKFESSWNLYVDNSKGDCPIEYSVATICDGKCGDGLSLMGTFEIECALGAVLCPFLYTVYDCLAEWKWQQENTCEGGRPVNVRRRICIDCKGDIVDEAFCRLSTGAVTMVERELCPTDNRYHTEWESSECEFHDPECYQNFTRKCVNYTWSLEGSPCDRENLEVTLPCQQKYDCCNCQNRIQCQECISSRIISSDEYLIGLPTEPTPNETPLSRAAFVEFSTESLNRNATRRPFENFKKLESGAKKSEAMIGTILGLAVLSVAMVVGSIYFHHRKKRLIKRKVEDQASVHSAVLSHL